MRSVRRSLSAGAEPPSRFGSFADLEAELRRGVAVLRSNPALQNRTQIRGYVYDLGTSTLKLVVDSVAAAEHPLGRRPQTATIP